MAHNLDDAGDVEQVGGPFSTKTEAEAEAERLGGSPLLTDSNWRNIPITVIDTKKGEQTAQTCVMAWFQHL
jgi:hypothetical protein